ncbi:MAG TPA: SusC/RagA family TonB-linked outer membrane protein [Gemmatimonadaceae bacterium]|nr:SusC/RagA family TonB-linked outer membrane protein [Gemmatimonadaceae bacterium]
MKLFSLTGKFRKLAVAAGLALPGTVLAQGEAITGRVVDRVTQQPVASAQVQIVGTQRGARTGDDGRYRIVNAPTGTFEVRALRIGYSFATQSVTVGSGATAVANFSLSPSATSLDEVVVSATGESQRRRESGVATARIDTSQLKMANVQNFSDVLSSRAPGVVVQQAGGETGGSSRIRIRGSNSIQLSNDPLLIIDGVRVNNNPNSSAIGTGGQTPSRFNDINPEDIENVEVIKGPAAAALYGTAASNGVIQVTTKRGRAGKPRWATNAEYGTVRQSGVYPNNYTQIGTNLAGTARITNCNLDAQARLACLPKADSLAFTNPIANQSPFRDGWRESYGLNVSGGSDASQYYLGGDFEREEGVYSVNWLRKTNLRANINSQPFSKLTLAINSGYLSSRQRRPQNDNNTLGAISGALIGKAFDCTLPRVEISCGVDTLGRGYRTANHTSTRFMAIDTRQNVEHFIGSGNATYQPFSWLSAIGVGGYDLIQRNDDETWPSGVIEVFVPQGYRQRAAAQIRTYTGNGSLVGTFQPVSSVRLVSTAGVQWGREVFTRTDAYGETLLAGTGSLGGTSTAFTVGESNSDIVTIGSLFQQRLEWRDKVFLSAGLRADKNSNFGVNLPFVKYPAVQGSWVLSDESFFPKTSAIRGLRLRAAYGESGQRPDFRQADKFFSPVAVSVNGLDVSGVTLGGAGNSDLRPERTKEYEFGFEASLIGDRIGVEFTRYHKSTGDALIGRRLAPSVGATVSQLVNLGEVENKGYEYQLNLRPVDTRMFKAGLIINGSVNDNLVKDLGKDALGNPITPIIFGLGGDTQRHQNGYPLGGYWARQIVSFEDKNGDGKISRVNCPTYGTTTNTQIAGGPACEIVLSDTAVYSGNPLGRTELSLTPSVTLMKWLNIQALFDHRGGLTLNNSTEYFRCNTGPNECLAVQSKTAPLEDQARAISTFMGTRGAYFEKADFWKLRELSMTLSAPQTLANSLRVGGLSLTVAGRNLKTWTDYKGLDPELNTSSASNFNTADFLTQPPVKYWVTRLNVTF